MISLRRARVLVLAATFLLAGCGGGDIIDGTGASGSQRAGFPSGSGSAPSSAAVPSGPASTPTPAASSPSGTPVVALRSLTGNTTSVQLDPGFYNALAALKIMPGLVGTARLAAGAILFPVTGGDMAVYAPGATQLASGSVEHSGSGFTLTAGSTKVSLTELRVDVGDAPQLNGTVSVNGKVVVRAVTVFDINDDSLRATGSTGSASVSGLGLRMDSGLSDLLNTTFKTQAFTSGLVLGTATMTLTGS